MTNASLPPVVAASSSVVPPALVTAWSDSETARMLEITAVENYRASMRAHHQPMSSAAKGLVLKAKADADEQIKLSQLASNLALQ